MALRPTSHSRLGSIAIASGVLAALWSSPAFAQVPLSDAAGVTSHVKGAGDQVKGTVNGTKDAVKGKVQDAGNEVKDALQAPPGAATQAGKTVTQAGRTVTQAVNAPGSRASGGGGETVGTTTTLGSGSSTAATAARTKAGGKKKRDGRGGSGDDRRRAQRSATVVENVGGLVMVDHGCVLPICHRGFDEGTKVAAKRFGTGSVGAGGILSLTGAALLAYLVFGAVLLSAGSIVAGCGRGWRRLQRDA